MFDNTKNKKHYSLASLLLSICGIVLCNMLLGMSRSISYRIIWVLVFALLVIGTYRFLMLKEIRLQLYSAIFSGIFILAQTIGYRLQIAQYSGMTGWALCIGISVCFAPAAAYGFIMLMRLIEKTKPALNSRPKTVFWISFVIILLGWIPVFLAYYPGLFTYDVGVQIPQILSWEFSARHPLLHTLFIGFFYQVGCLLGNENIGIAIASIVQMLIMAGIFSWLIRYLYLCNSPRFLWLGTLIMFSLLPVYSILSISMTKDVLFTGFFLLFIIRIHQLTLNPKLLHNIQWSVLTVSLGTLACMFRNNTMFSLIVFIPLCIFLLPKPYRLRCLILLSCTVVVFFSSHAGLKAILNAHGSYTREYVSIPSQQLARVYTLHKDDYENSNVIKWNVPASDAYIPFTADNTKGSAQVLTSESLVSFIKLWGLVGLKYPMEYIDAFLLNTQGYWWLDDTTHAAIYGETRESRSGYLSTNTASDYSVTHIPLLPKLENLYEHLFSANAYQEIPFFSFLFAPAVYIWFMLFSLFRGLYLRRKEYVMISGFLICYLLTLMLGPCVLVRYAYPFFVCFPLLLLPRISPKKSDCLITP